MAEHESSGASIGGYRVTRKLGSGSRADVYLGSGASGSVALKVFRDTVDRSDIGNELAALGRLDFAHCARLVDLASTEDDCPLFVLERVHRGSVATLLSEREQLEAGEVVTLLAPLAGLLPQLHRGGVAHGRIGASSLHLGGNGEPVLLGFGHSELFAAGQSIAAIDAEPAARRDRDALAALTTSLLTRVRNAGIDQRVTRLLEWIDTAPREFEFVERLEARLFDLAEPLAVRFPDRSASVTSVPARFDSSGTRAASVAREQDAPVDDPPAQAATLRRLDELLRHNPIEALRNRVLAAARTVRRRYWIAAALGLVGLIVAISVLPQGGPSAPPTSNPTATGEPFPTALALPDDPVQALPLLLVARTACVRELSVLCLDTIDDQNSGAYGSDAALIEQLQGGTEIPTSAIITASAPRLVEVLGNSAIVSLGAQSNPASVLMIKTEAGWRIRSYLSGVQATASPAPTN